MQRNSGDADLVYRTTDNGLLPAPQPQPEANFSHDDEEPWAFDSLQFDTLAAAFAQEADRTRAELSKALAKRDKKIAAL